MMMPTYHYHKYLKDWMEYHNIEHDYKVLKQKNRVKEENEMLQNEMTRVRNMRKKSQTYRLWSKRSTYER